MPFVKIWGFGGRAIPRAPRALFRGSCSIGDAASPWTVTLPPVTPKNWRDDAIWLYDIVSRLALATPAAATRGSLGGLSLTLVPLADADAIASTAPLSTPGWTLEYATYEYPPTDLPDASAARRVFDD